MASSPVTLVRNINPFERLSYAFVRNNNRSNDLVTRLLNVRTAWSSVLWRSFEFSVKWHAWETSYAIRSKKLTCSSGHLTRCFQDLFDFICTSLSALNSYFALLKKRCSYMLKKHAYTSANHGVDFFSDVADYKLFSVHNPLSDEKSKLKISYVNKTFQKKPEHFCSPHVYITNKIFFCQRLVLRKKHGESKKPM